MPRLPSEFAIQSRIDAKEREAKTVLSLHRAMACAAVTAQAAEQRDDVATEQRLASFRFASMKYGRRENGKR